MKRKRHTPEQVVRKLREGDRLLNEGKELAEVLRHLEVFESSWNRWRAQYGAMQADEAKRLKKLERENSRLKKLVAHCHRSEVRRRDRRPTYTSRVHVARRRAAVPRQFASPPRWILARLPL